LWKKKSTKQGKIMRTPNFGQDITNTQQNRGNGNDDEESRQQQIISRLQENGATPVAAMAGKGIIRVVSRCEDAKENSNLGESNDAIIFRCAAENKKVKIAKKHFLVVVAASSINLTEIN
jgi:hypothetical protein